MTSTALAPTATGWFGTDAGDLDQFRATVEQSTDLADYPYADEVREKVLVYGPGLREHVATAAGRRNVQTELARTELPAHAERRTASSSPGPEISD